MKWIVSLGAMAAMWLGNAFGHWEVTVLAGLLLGLAGIGKRPVLGSLIVGMLAWGLELAWVARTAEVGALAQVIGGLLGLQGTLAKTAGLLLPPVVGGVLALAGGWVGSTLRNVWNGSQAAGQRKSATDTSLPL